jgi:hypothetical protein
MKNTQLQGSLLNLRDAKLCLAHSKKNEKNEYQALTLATSKAKSREMLP